VGLVATLNVLVVDDEPIVRDVLAAVLRRRVASVTTSGNGREALEIMRINDPPIDLVFLDLLMPKMDGIEVIRHMAAREKAPSFAFVSGVNATLLSAAVHLAASRGIPVVGTIEKPVTGPAVEAILKLSATVKRREARQSGLAIPEEQLLAALREKWLELHYQPKVNLKTGAVEGFESLVRLRHPDHGLVPPGIFIPLAEESGLITSITNQVLILALAQCAAWRDAGVVTKISVNISAKMLVDLNLPDRIEAEAKRCGADPHQIILEVTESGVFADEGDTMDILTRLCMKGFQLSIDDFGTGYSSMQQLRRVPFAELKIDRAFVTGIRRGSKDYSILDSSVALGKKLGLTVVAEGAETQEDMELLESVGADLVQGYHVAKPMTADKVLPWIADWKRTRGAEAPAT
jgi:EAL domain-containing protein (putative c-di-GMP-specific phosphodiesterase class I)/AmiR/NasT family two-component response regulator